jgi:hypothetical protein
VFLLALAYYLRFVPWCVRLYENGLTFRHGWKTDTIAWGDVDRLYELIRHRGRPEHIIRLYLVDGRRFRFDYVFRRINELADGIRARVTAAVLRRARHQLQAGEEVPFGALFLSRRGLRLSKDVVRMRGREIPWEEVEGIRLGVYRDLQYQGSSIEIRQRGATRPWHWEKFTNFPNAQTFLQLAQQFTTVEA